ncbi:MAG: transposase family protein [Coprococcus sp.]
MCPKCKTESRKYHAVHRRKVRDLPILGKKTILLISLYEFDCESCIGVDEFS